MENKFSSHVDKDSENLLWPESAKPLAIALAFSLLIFEGQDLVQWALPKLQEGTSISRLMSYSWKWGSATIAAAFLFYLTSRSLKFISLALATLLVNYLLVIYSRGAVIRFGTFDEYRTSASVWQFPLIAGVLIGILLGISYQFAKRRREHKQRALISPWLVFVPSALVAISTIFIMLFDPVYSVFPPLRIVTNAVLIGASLICCVFSQEEIA